MFIGQTLLTNDDTSGNTYYSPWFPRGGNAAVFACEVTAVGDLHASTPFRISVETKAQEDDDSSPTTVTSNQAITVTSLPAVTKFESGSGITGSGFKDLVRFKYNVMQDASSPSFIGWVHFRMLNPSWVTD